MQFSEIGISNFRIFNEEFYFYIKPITILTGTNSSGKSTLIKAIRLLKTSLGSASNEQSDSLFHRFNELILDIDLNLGDYTTWFNKNNNKSEISYSFPLLLEYNFTRYKIIFTYDRDKQKIPNGELKSVVILEEDTQNIIISIDNKDVFVDVIGLWTQLLDFYKFSSKFIEFEAIIAGKIEEECPWLVKKEKIDIKLPHHGMFGYNFLSSVTAALFSTDKVKISIENSEELLFTHDELYKILNIEQYNLFLEYQNKFIHYCKSYSNSRMESIGFESGPILILDVNKCDVNNYKRFRSLYSMMLKICKDFDPKLPLLCYNFENDMTTQEKESSQKEKLFLKLQNEEIHTLNAYLNFHDNNSFLNASRKLTLNINNCNESLYETTLRGMETKDESFFESFILNKKGTSKFIRDNLIKGGSIAKKAKNLPYTTNLNFFIDSIFKPIKSLTEDIPKSIRRIHFIPAFKILNIRREYILKKGDYFDDLLVNYSKLKADQKIEFDSVISEIIGNLEIAKSINFNLTAGNVSCTVELKDFNDNLINLADYGNGISQILPTIFFCCLNYISNKENKGQKGETDIIIIEEPESNLHPALQSKLADLFVSLSSKFSCHFIIETHSEYLIRKLQILTIDKNSYIKKEDIQIYYFYHPNAIPEGKSQILSINIENDGSLSNAFGKGFFDVSSNLNFELYIKHKPSKN